MGDLVDRRVREAEQGSPDAEEADTGVYTCMVTNVAGNSNASAYLNVSTAELNTSNYSFFTTVTVETTEISPEDTTRKYKPVPITPIF